MRASLSYTMHKTQKSYEVQGLTVFNYMCKIILTCVMFLYEVLLLDLCRATLQKITKGEIQWI